jgi:hypothetical protein
VQRERHVPVAPRVHWAAVTHVACQWSSER